MISILDALEHCINLKKAILPIDPSNATFQLGFHKRFGGHSISKEDKLVTQSLRICSFLLKKWIIMR